MMYFKHAFLSFVMLVVKYAYIAGSMLNVSMNASVTDDISMERILHNVKTVTISR